MSVGWHLATVLRAGLVVAALDGGCVLAGSGAAVHAADGAVLSQSPSGSLVPPDDNEDVSVDKDHGQQRGEEEARVLAAEMDTLDEIRRTVGVLCRQTWI